MIVSFMLTSIIISYNRLDGNVIKCAWWPGNCVQLYLFTFSYNIVYQIGVTLPWTLFLYMSQLI